MADEFEGVNEMVAFGTTTDGEFYLTQQSVLMLNAVLRRIRELERQVDELTDGS